MFLHLGPLISWGQLRRIYVIELIVHNPNFRRSSWEKINLEHIHNGFLVRQGTTKKNFGTARTRCAIMYHTRINCRTFIFVRIGGPKNPTCEPFPPVSLPKFSWRFNKKSSHLSFQQTPVQPFWRCRPFLGNLRWQTKLLFDAPPHPDDPYELWNLQGCSKKSGSDRWIIWNVTIPIPSMGLVYLPTWMVDFYGKFR